MSNEKEPTMTTYKVIKEQNNRMGEYHVQQELALKTAEDRTHGFSRDRYLVESQVNEDMTS